jgi:hypothetical protein
MPLIECVALSWQPKGAGLGMFGSGFRTKTRKRLLFSVLDEELQAQGSGFMVQSSGFDQGVHHGMHFDKFVPV